MKNKIVAIIALSAMELAFQASTALAADPVILKKAGNETTFPTYAFGGTTTLCVKRLNPHHYALVRVNAGAQDEKVHGNTQPNCIKRQWGGVKIGITNIRSDQNVPVEVWTY